jgi:Protein of unknown function (DUF3800)
MGIYTGYFDESSDEENPYFVMGGIILDDETATSFDRDWREAIKGLPRLEGEPFLHTADFVSGNKQYDPDWKGRYHEKLAILSDAARVISHYSLQTITTVVDMEHFRAVDSKLKASETVGHPYTVAARVAYQHMEQWAKRNSVSTPIKLILEERHGIGDAIEMFRINGHPPPDVESKGLPQLQAADYIAWMRLKKYYPSSSYEQVKASWNDINKILYTDQIFDGWSLLLTIQDAAAQIPETPFPRRDDNQTLVTFNSNFKRPRQPFKGTARPRPKKEET